MKRLRQAIFGLGRLCRDLPLSGPHAVERWGAFQQSSHVNCPESM